MIPFTCSHRVFDRRWFSTSPPCLPCPTTRCATLVVFFTDNAEGILRGPFLRSHPAPSRDRCRIRSTGELTGSCPFSIRPPFERLSSVYGRQPQPTIVTTGTRSGKTECFLIPVLDHCRRMRANGHNGIKGWVGSGQVGRRAAVLHQTLPGRTDDDAGLPQFQLMACGSPKMKSSMTATSLSGPSGDPSASVP